MADWVHCNVCHYQPGQLPKREFQLTSCGHIFCLCCERTGPIEQCKMCQVKCTTVLLNNQMAPEVMAFFEEPADLLSKTVKVLQFQKSHSKKLIEYYRSVLEKYMRAKGRVLQLEEEVKHLKKKIEIMQSENILSPPPNTTQQPLFSKNSQASKVIRMGFSQPNPLNSPMNSSPFFATPSRVQSCGSQQYRSQNLSRTPESDRSYSPASQSSGGSRGMAGAGRSNSSQYSYKSYTPPANSLSMMYLRTPQPRKDSRN